MPSVFAHFLIIVAALTCLLVSECRHDSDPDLVAVAALTCLLASECRYVRAKLTLNSQLCAVRACFRGGVVAFVFRREYIMCPDTVGAEIILTVIVFSFRRLMILPVIQTGCGHH